MMKKALLMFPLAALVSLSACDTQTSGDINVHTNEIQYRKDHRTNLCFAFLASRKSNMAGIGQMTGMGMTQVPCSEKVMKRIP